MADATVGEAVCIATGRMARTPDLRESREAPTARAMLRPGARPGIALTPGRV